MNNETKNKIKLALNLAILFLTISRLVLLLTEYRLKDKD